LTISGRTESGFSDAEIGMTVLNHGFAMKKHILAG